MSPSKAWEGIKAMGYVVGILLSAMFLAEFVWLTPNGDFIPFFYESVASIIGEPETAFAALGVWSGLTVAWFVDTYKRQLSFMPVIFAGSVLSAVNFGKLLTGASVEALLWFAVTLYSSARGVDLEIESVVRRAGDNNTFLNSDRYEYPNAPRFIFWIIVLLVFLGTLDVFISNIQSSVEWLPFGSLLAGGCLIFCFYRITDYGSDIRIIQLGPPRSGKSTMLAGLYADATKAKAEEGKGLLREIARKIKHKNTLPEGRTSSGEFIRFSYLSSDWLFRNKISVTSYDHKGEILTGGDNQSLREQIEQHREYMGHDPYRRGVVEVVFGRLKRLLRGRKRYWTIGLEEIQKAKAPKEGRKGLAKLVDGADIVIFTVPMEDFLDPVIERENEQSYQRVFRIESNPDSDVAYQVEDADSQWNLIKNEEHLVYECTGEKFECPQSKWRDLNDGRSYCLPDSHERDLSEYRNEYKELIEFFGADKSFIWTATMTDLTLNDYKPIYNTVVEHEEDNNKQTNSAKSIISEAKNISDAFETGFPAVLNSAEPQQVFGYKLLAEWIQQEYIRNEWPAFCTDNQDGDGELCLLPESGERFVYPVWFNIDKDESRRGGTLRVDETGLGSKIEPKQILIGSDWILRRIEGKTLVGNHLFEQTFKCYEALKYCKEEQLFEDECR